MRIDKTFEEINSNFKNNQFKINVYFRLLDIANKIFADQDEVRNQKKQNLKNFFKEQAEIYYQNPDFEINGLNNFKDKIYEICFDKKKPETTDYDFLKTKEARYSLSLLESFTGIQKVDVLGGMFFFNKNALPSNLNSNKEFYDFLNTEEILSEKDLKDVVEKYNLKYLDLSVGFCTTNCINALENEFVKINNFANISNNIGFNSIGINLSTQCPLGKYGGSCGVIDGSPFKEDSTKIIDVNITHTPNINFKVDDSLFVICHEMFHAYDFLMNMYLNPNLKIEDLKSYVEIDKTFKDIVLNTETKLDDSFKKDLFLRNVDIFSKILTKYFKKEESDTDFKMFKSLFMEQKYSHILVDSLYKEIKNSDFDSYTKIFEYYHEISLRDKNNSKKSKGLIKKISAYDDKINECGTYMSSLCEIAARSFEKILNKDSEDVNFKFNTFPNEDEMIVFKKYFQTFFEKLKDISMNMNNQKLTIKPKF